MPVILTEPDATRIPCRLPGQPQTRRERVVVGAAGTIVAALAVGVLEVPRRGSGTRLRGHRPIHRAAGDAHAAAARIVRPVPRRADLAAENTEHLSEKVSRVQIVIAHNPCAGCRRPSQCWWREIK